MKKIKYILTAALLCSALSVGAFAADAPTSSKPAGSGSLAESDKNVDTGVGGVAAVVGVITLAGAAVVISRKK